jgi:hypothetical protein
MTIYDYNYFYIFKGNIKLNNKESTYYFSFLIIYFIGLMPLKKIDNYRIKLT